MKRKTVGPVERLQQVAEVMPTADALRFFNQLLEVRKEQLTTAREIAKIDAAREVALKEISKKYALLHKIFDRVFEERSDAINKHFEIIDKGLRHNDRELILGGSRASPTSLRAARSATFRNSAVSSNLEVKLRFEQPTAVVPEH